MRIGLRVEPSARRDGGTTTSPFVARTAPSGSCFSSFGMSGCKKAVYVDETDGNYAQCMDSIDVYKTATLRLRMTM